MSLQGLHLYWLLFCTISIRALLEENNNAHNIHFSYMSTCLCVNATNYKCMLRCLLLEAPHLLNTMF